MSRFWMVQHLMTWVSLLLNTIFDWSLWAFGVGVLGFCFSGWQFAKAAERDDQRRIHVANLTITTAGAR